MADIEDILGNYTERFSSIETSVKKIETALLGDFEKRGFIRETDIRVTSLEKFKCVFIKLFWVVAITMVTGLIGGCIGMLFK